MAREIMQFDDAHIIFKNFSGAASKYNREGDRNFGLVIEDPELALKMADDGWNIKIRPPRDEGETTFYWLPVKVKFGDFPPDVYLVVGKNMRKLDEETVGEIDEVSINRVDLDIRPYNWTVNDKTGTTAYLQDIRVVQNVDRFASEYNEGM